MALVPCKVCGTLNSDEAEICLSCEYPIDGPRRPLLFQWVAVALCLLFLLPVLGAVVQWLKPKAQPQRSERPSVSLIVEGRDLFQ